jgi:hypothetical protein
MIDRRTTKAWQDPEVMDILNYICDEALGNPTLLSAAPTTAGAELRPNQSGYYSNALYININGTTFSITLTPV